MQVQVQAGRFHQVAEQLGNERAICVVPDPFPACELINTFCYAKENDEYNHYDKGLLANPRLPSVQFQHNKIYIENHEVDLSRVALIATRNNSVSKEPYVSYHKT